MTDLRLTAEQQQAYQAIELRILFQRAIEILDDLKKTKFKNKSLQSQLTAIYPSLDKQTKIYDELYKASSAGVTDFYNTVVTNNLYIMNYNIIDQALISFFLTCHEKSPKAVEGILNKVIKQ